MRRAAAGATAATLLLSALLVAAASASYDPLASGRAVIALAPSFRAQLREEGIRLSGREGVKVKGQQTVVLPVGGGEADPLISKGSFELGGELVLSSARKHLSFKFVTVNTKPSPLYAKVGGGQQKVARSGQAKFSRHGFSYVFEAKGLRLSKKTATRLGKRLKAHGLEAGQLLGSLKVTAQPETVAVLPEGRATLTLDPAFAAKLSSLFVSRNPIFPAEHQGDTFTFPIAPEGQLAPDASSGTLRTAGAMELLQLGAGQLFWQELWIQPAAARVLGEAELDPSPPYPGKQPEAGIFSMGPGHAASDPGARTITVTGAPLTLTPITAQNLNEGFSRPQDQGDLFAPGEAAGSVSFTAQGQ